jgi:hypothetical protein
MWHFLRLVQVSMQRGGWRSTALRTEAARTVPRSL